MVFLSTFNAVVIAVAALRSHGVEQVRGCEERDAVKQFHSPVTLVDKGMVITAKERRIVNVGFASIVPRNDVVRFRPRCRDSAIGEATPEITRKQDFALCGCK